MDPTDNAPTGISMPLLTTFIKITSKVKCTDAWYVRLIAKAAFSARLWIYLDLQREDLGGHRDVIGLV